MTWFVNYSLDALVAPADRGLAYGDGVFETIPMHKGRCKNLDVHLKRLCRGLKKLGMPFLHDEQERLLNFLESDLQPFLSNSDVVKVIVTRGEGGRGYLPPEMCHHTVMVGVFPAPDYLLQRKHGVSLSVSPINVSVNRYLSGIKHLNRLDNVLAKQHLKEGDFEALMLTPDGTVVECIQSNVFWFKQGCLYTPSLISSGVQGTARRVILEEQTIYCVQTGVYPLLDVMSADEIFITNSLMGIVPVVNFSEKSFPIGFHTQKLQTLFSV